MEPLRKEKDMFQSIKCSAKAGRPAIGRRMFLKSSAMLAAAGPWLASSANGEDNSTSTSVRPDTKRDHTVAGAGVATVEIETGKIAGYVAGDIYTFKGIPYGDTTEGANRFRPAKKPKPWTGVRSSREFSFVCPQDKGTGRQHDEESFIFHWNDSIEGEDCLRVNVWTPGLDGKKRPVMVWLHGGGFEAGSGNDLPAFDGENLARRGDVVVVTLNHRLNILGYLDLSKYGEKYAQSANVGMLDIVAALEWVRDNIVAFGGDPGRVLIFGQSGGGAKVGTLMGMPAAKGLFHRAIVESGSFQLSNTTDKSQKLADLILKELGLDASTVDQLQTLPYAELRRASEAVMRIMNPPMTGFRDIRKMAARLHFGPVIDGKILPEPLFNQKAPLISADVPMIIGTTLNEYGTGMNHPEYELLKDSDIEARVEDVYPGYGKQIVAAFRQRTPHAKPYDLLSRITSTPVRQAAIDQATAKTALNRAPAYLYWFTWQTPVFDGRPGAFHCSEISFVFSNTDRCATMTGGGADARALSARMTDAWVQFARTGDPNHAGIPHWEPFSSQTIPTMVFDNEVLLLPDPDANERKNVPDLITVHH
jgi:para-nitrobenzyl esterase